MAHLASNLIHEERHQVILTNEDLVNIISFFVQENYAGPKLPALKVRFAKDRYGNPTATADWVEKC